MEKNELAATAQPHIGAVAKRLKRLHTAIEALDATDPKVEAVKLAADRLHLRLQAGFEALYEATDGDVSLDDGGPKPDPVVGDEDPDSGNGG